MSILKLDPRDNVVVALRTLRAGDPVRLDEDSFTVGETVPAKHKMAIAPLATGDLVFLYGMVVGEAVTAVPRGGLLTPKNVRHRAGEYTPVRVPVDFAAAPDAEAWRARTFNGYFRADGQVGTRNYWLVLPLVFCENRNVEKLREALDEELGYARPSAYRQLVRRMVRGESTPTELALEPAKRLFPNIDGIRFLTHEGGCGGTRQDAQALCGLLAGYIHHPNVAGATVLSLGCQNAQAGLLMDELGALDPQTRKPVLLFDQQKMGREQAMLNLALEETFAALKDANHATRSPAPLAALTVGLKCGGSDGFSGISANPAVGRVSDLVAAAGGRTLLSEFPELHGVEQALINRCANDEIAQKFHDLMRAYQARARAVGSGFEANPSPGNIADGLTTDAIKSAGAARKSGISQIGDVIDYPEYATTPGLNLQCTPGNDVECVTAQVGAGANLVLFTTGLGTPTGNPIAPVVKIATNSALAEHMSDIIDFDAGPVMIGELTIAQCADRLLEYSIAVASGALMTKSELRGQNDFIPWKRGISL